MSNIETQIEAIRLFEAWADIPIGGGGSLRFGLYDLNSEFDAVDAGALFLNSSHGIGAEFASSGQNGPSIFPVTSLALRLQRTITPQWTVRAAILDAVPGDPNYPKRTAIKLSDEQGALLIAEIERQSGGTRFVAGHWFYTRDQARFDAAGVAPSRGGYALLERRLAGDEDGTEGELRGFARAGFADRRTSPVAAYFGAGLNWSQPFMFEREHALGLAVAWAEFGRPYRRETLAKQREVNVELTYRHSLSDYVTVQPDIQLIFSPAGDPSLDTAIAAGLRVVLEL